MARGGPRKGKRRKWVIFARPEQHGPGAENVFFDSNGVETTSRSRAKKSCSYEEAKAFATAKGIKLNAVPYIHQFDFDESELGDEN